MVDLLTPIKTVVGGKTAQALSNGLAIETVGDLLYHFPRRYAERGQHTELSELLVGTQATILAQVLRVNRRPMRNRRGNLLEVTVGDGVTTLTLTFFNQAWREKELTPGRWGLFAGKVGQFRGTRQLQHPEYQLLAGEASDSTDQLEEFAGTLIPVYPATAALPSWAIARCVRLALDMIESPVDPLPANIREAEQVVDLASALREIHRPSEQKTLTQARRRLAFDEAFALQVILAQRRAAATATPAHVRPRKPSGLLADFDQALPFQLTEGQREVGEVISDELSSTRPMHRLLQGEVGSGKTVVALRAMLQVIDAGGQAALLAPTEVLAAQHERSIRVLLGPLSGAGELGAADHATRIALLTGSLTTVQRRQALAEVASGAAGIVIGTHALLQEGVEFADLGLVVIDEQHRFGVEQRDLLRAKAGDTPPHTLVMTATPIPRTVAMTVFGDLDVSALTELPKGRSPISTTVVPAGEKPGWLERTWERLVEEVAAGHQAYVVFPRIGGVETSISDDTEDELSEPTESDEERRNPLALLETAPSLSEGPLGTVSTGVLHGRLNPEEKDAVMRAFSTGKIDVLFTTTIVEVGVDVPNATVMVIMDAERFGVSQLHQLRGRVGRGAAAGLCLLVTQSPSDTPSRQRLDAVSSTLDGFRLAEIDLEQRREGDVLGSSQSGRRSHLKLLSLLRDTELISRARTTATTLVAEDPDLTHYPELAQTIEMLINPERADYLHKA